MGARPLGLRGCYGPDEAALKAYVARARAEAATLRQDA
jgi:hypothetical protein